MKLQNENFMTLPTNYRVIETMYNVYLSLEKLNKICLKHHIIMLILELFLNPLKRTH